MHFSHCNRKHNFDSNDSSIAFMCKPPNFSENQNKIFKIGGNRICCISQRGLVMLQQQMTPVSVTHNDECAFLAHSTCPSRTWSDKADHCSFSESLTDKATTVLTIISHLPGGRLSLENYDMAALSLLAGN